MPRVSHFEFSAKNIEKTIEFYKEVFDWKVEKWDGPIDYWFLKTGDSKEEGIDGGLARREDGEEPLTINIIDVEDIDKAIKRIVKYGGKIVREKSPVQGIGWLVYFKDPDGTFWGMMQEDPNAK